MKLLGAGINAEINFRDSEYMMPSWKFICHEFNSSFKKLLGDFFGIKKWDRAYDCDKFASMYCAMTAFSHFLSQKDEEKPVVGLAIGWCWYVRDAGGAHAINFMFERSRGLSFIEPQGPYMVSLSKDEINSIDEAVI